MSAWQILLLASAYFALLFFVANYGDQRARSGRSLISANVYALSIAVYCTSWTYFGSVGSATTGGLGFLAVYLGPTLTFLFAGVPIKMLRISKAQRLTSIADFIAARYGKSQFLAGLVTIIAVIGIVPYIALQLKAVSSGIGMMFPHPVQAGASTQHWWSDTTLFAALGLAAFAVWFGARHLDTTERHEGMVLAIAFESVAKLVAFLAVGSFVVWGMFDGFSDLFSRVQQDPAIEQLLRLESLPSSGWASTLLLSGLAILLLPRQFQVMVVENVDEHHIRRALWLFPLYMLLINVFVLPIALGGMLSPELRGRNADTFVVSLPLLQGQPVLAALAYIGGLSAATGMVIVETVALSTMVCNDLVMPILLRLRGLALQMREDLSSLLLTIRRATILVVLLLGYLYFRAAGEAYALVSIGMISFAAVAQFAPVVLGALYWKQGTRWGAAAGLMGGFGVWLYSLLLPSFAQSGWIGDAFVRTGAFGLTWLRPQALFGLENMGSIAHSVFWSLTFNTTLFVFVSLFTRRNVVEITQASAYVDVFRQAESAPQRTPWRGQASKTEIVRLLRRFLGEARVLTQLDQHAHERGLRDRGQLVADAEFVRFAETLLAGALGAASARAIVSSVVREEEINTEEVLDILDEARRIRAYSEALEAKSQQLELATRELRQANERLLELDRMKDDFVSTVTHELRTPLTSIRLFSEILESDLDMEAEERKRFLHIIVSESERLARLINQILDLAKLEAGRAEWTNADVDLVPLVRDTAETMSQLFREREASLTLDLPDHPTIVLGDRDRLTQVLVNLLSNAVKFVPRSVGRVCVVLRSNPQSLPPSLRLEVRDNGPGIRPEDREVIFEKFRQGGNTLTDKPKGTGLGLPIARQIVEHLGGALWAEAHAAQPAAAAQSQAEAALPGAVFVMTLPLAQPKQATQDRAEAQPDAQSVALTEPAPTNSQSTLAS